MLSRRTASVLLLLAILLLTACTAGPNQLVGDPGPDGRVAGFWLGLWHGFISFFAFLASLFTDRVGIYAVHNTGGWYDFGFILGAMMFYGGGGGQARSRSGDG